MIMRTRLAALLFIVACSPKSPTAEPPSSTAANPSEPVAEDGGGDKTAGDAAECRPTGCSAAVCSDEEVMTTCEFRPEYACYKDATCARQPDGECGWTKSAELDACLANPPAAQ